MREALAQVTGDDALNPLIDLDDTFPGTSVQRPADPKAKKRGGNHAKRERTTNDARDLRDFVDISSNHQHVAVRQTSRDQADRLFLPAIFVQPVRLGALCRT